MTVAALCMGVLIQNIKYPLANIFDQTRFWGILGQGAIAAVAGLFIYAILCYILKLDEMTLFIQSLQKKWLKIKNVPTETLAETKNNYE